MADVSLTAAFSTVPGPEQEAIKRLITETVEQLAQEDRSFTRARLVFTESDERCGLTAELDGSSWTMPPLFKWLQQHGGVADAEMHRVFNCGIGMTVIVSAENADAAVAQLTAAGETVSRIGKIRARAEGEHQTIVV